MAMHRGINCHTEVGLMNLCSKAGISGRSSNPVIYLTMSGANKTLRMAYAVGMHSLADEEVMVHQNEYLSVAFAAYRDHQH